MPFYNILTSDGRKGTAEIDVADEAKFLADMQKANYKAERAKAYMVQRPDGKVGKTVIPEAKIPSFLTSMTDNKYSVQEVLPDDLPSPALTGIKEAGRKLSFLMEGINSGLSFGLTKEAEKVPIASAAGGALALNPVTMPAYLSAKATQGLKQISSVEGQTAQPQDLVEAGLEGAGTMAGQIGLTMATAGALNPAMQKALAGQRLLVKTLALRLATGGAMSGANNLVSAIRGEQTPSQAVQNFGVSTLANVVGAIPEHVIPAGAKNFTGQVLTDFVYDMLTDKYVTEQLKSWNPKDLGAWLATVELPQLAASVAFAARDYNDPDFEGIRQQTIADLKQKFVKDVAEHAPIMAKGAQETKQPPPMPQEATKQPLETAITPEVESQATLTPEAKELFTGQKVEAEQVAEKKPAFDRIIDSFEKQGFQFVDSDATEAVKIGNERFPTFVAKDGSKIAMSVSPIAQRKGEVFRMTGVNKPNELTAEVIYVPEALRKKGRGRELQKQLFQAADEAGVTLRGEPAPPPSLAKKTGLTRNQLVDWYKRSGWQEEQKGSDLILVRKPQEVSDAIPEQGASEEVRGVSESGRDVASSIPQVGEGNAKPEVATGTKEEVQKPGDKVKVKQPKAKKVYDATTSTGRKVSDLKAEIERRGLSGEIDNLIGRLKEAEHEAAAGNYGLQVTTEESSGGQGKITGFFNQGRVYPEGMNRGDIHVLSKFRRGESLTDLQADRVEKALTLIGDEVFRTMPKESINTAELSKGDTVTIDGDPHKVISKTEGRIVIKDGQTFAMKPGEELVIDKDSYDPSFDVADMDQKAEDFDLERVTEEQIQTEKDKKIRKEKMAEGVAKPIEGRPVDTTGDLFDAEKAKAPLFAPPTPKPQAEAKAEPVAQPKSEAKPQSITEAVNSVQPDIKYLKKKLERDFPYLKPETLDADIAAVQNGDISFNDFVKTYNLNPEDKYVKNLKPVAKKSMGPGAASGAEFEPSELRKMSNKNADVDRDRVARGLEPLMSQASQSQGQWWKEAMDKIDNDVTAPDRLIEELKTTPRTIDPVESSMLLHRRVDLMNERDRAGERYDAARKAGYEDQMQSARMDYERWSKAINDLDEATKGAGTAWGRAGMARQMVARSDFSLVKMERDMEMAKGAPLTKEEVDKVKEIQKTIEANEAKIEAKTTEAETQASREELEKTISDLKMELAMKPEYHPKIIEYAERFAKYMDKKAEAASARLRERMSRASSGLDPLWVADLAIVGAAKIARGVSDSVKWSAIMVKEWGDIIKPHLDEIWAKSNQNVEEDLARMTDTETAKQIKKKISKIPQPEERADVVERIKLKVNEADQFQISRFVRMLAKSFIAENDKITRDELIDAIHSELKQVIPDLTRRQAMDAISGYGQFKQLTRSEIDAKLRDLKGQMQQVAKLEDLLARTPPQKTGIERRVPTDAERRLIQLVNEYKKSFGIQVTDVNTQIKSALDSRKKAIRNQIADLEYQINTQQKIIKQRNAPPTDAELKALIAQRDELKQQYDNIFGVPKLSPEQRLSRAIAGAERNQEYWQKKLANAQQGKFGKVETPAQPAVKSAELDAIKAKTEALKREVQRLKDIANPKKSPEEIALSSLKARLQESVTEYRRRIAENDFAKKPKREIKLDDEALKLRAESEMAKSEFRKQKAQYEYSKKSKAQKIALGTGEALNLSRSIKTSFDLSAVLRQGAFIVLGHPIRALKSFKAMFQAFRNPLAAAKTDAEIQSRPNVELYKKSGLEFTALDESKMSQKEEQFMSELADKIPFVAGSQRAFVTFLNKLRADSFDAMLSELVTSGTPTKEELQAIANYVNKATGRGSLGKTKNVGTELATIFFSPRLVASRFQLLLGQPFYHGSMMTRYMIAKEYARFLIGLGGVYGLGLLAGGTIEEDPRSSDFGKIRFGDTRVDPLAGLSQTAVFLSRFATGVSKSLAGRKYDIVGDTEYGRNDLADVITRFLRSKLTPVIGTALDIRMGENLVGEKVTPMSGLLSLAVPLSFADIYKVMKEQGVPAGTALSLLAIFGMGVANYDQRKKGKTTKTSKK